MGFIVLSMTSEAQRRANRANSRKSTGPRTASGKARSSRNAISHGVFTSGIVLAGDGMEDAGALEALRRALRDDLRPSGALEEILVDKLVGIIWRWRRLLRYEAATTEIRIDEAVRGWSTRQQERARITQHLDALTRPVGKEPRRSPDASWKSTSRLGLEVDFAEGFLIALEPEDPLADPIDPLAWALCTVLAEQGHNWRKLLEVPAELDLLDLEQVPPELLARLIQAVREPSEKLDDFWERLRSWAQLRLWNAQSELDDRLRHEERLRLEALVPANVLDRVVRYEAHFAREFARTLDQFSSRRV